MNLNFADINQIFLQRVKPSEGKNTKFLSGQKTSGHPDFSEYLQKANISGMMSDRQDTFNTRLTQEALDQNTVKPPAVRKMIEEELGQGQNYNPNVDAWGNPTWQPPAPMNQEEQIFQPDKANPGEQGLQMDLQMDQGYTPYEGVLEHTGLGFKGTVEELLGYVEDTMQIDPEADPENFNAMMDWIIVEGELVEEPINEPPYEPYEPYEGVLEHTGLGFKGTVEELLGYVEDTMQINPEADPENFNAMMDWIIGEGQLVDGGTEERPTN